MKIKIKRTINNYYYVMFLSIFVFGSVIRKSLFSGALGTGNIIFLVCELFIVVNAIKYNKVSYRGWILGSFLIALILYVDYETSSDVADIINAIVYTIIPSFLIEINVLSKVDSKNFIRIIIKFLNFFVIAVICMMFVDQLTGCAITQLLSIMFSSITSYLPSSYGFLQFRSPSYLGHELYNTHFIIMFYILNMLYSNEFGYKLIDRRILHIAAILGTVFTQSKMGLIVLFVAIVFFNFNSKNSTLNITFLIFGIGILYYIGLFEAVIERFSNTSFTTGRLTWLTYLSDQYGLNLRLFGGYGENLTSYFSMRLNSNNSGSWTNMIVTAAFESPMIIMAYRYGVVTCILWLVKIFGATTIRVFMTKSKAIIISYALMVAQVMTFNQLIYNPDLMCCVIIWNIIFIMFYKSKSEESIRLFRGLQDYK